MTRLVCVIGTDGSGKTTLSARLVEQLGESGVDARHEWLGAESYLMAPVRKALKLVWGRRRRSTTSGSSDAVSDNLDTRAYRVEIACKNDTVTRHAWAVRVYVLLVLLDYRLQLRRKLNKSRESDLVVADRYIFDVAVNLGLTLGWDPAAVVRFLQEQLTRVRLPDVRVFLRVEPEVSLARKNDIPDADYLRLRLAYYDAVAAAFGFEVRDGTRPIEETSAWLLQFTDTEMAKPHVHYVHANNNDVGGADKVLARMAEHMGSRAAETVGGFRTSVSLRLATDAVALHEAAGTPVLLREFERPQLSAGLRGLVRFGVAGPRTYAYFRRLFALQQPDLVHVNDVYDFLPALAARRAGVPVVYHLRMFQGLAPIRRGLARLIGRSSAASVAVSDAVRQHYFPRPVPGHHAEMIHDLGDASLMADQGDVLSADQRPAGVPEGGRLVTMVGRVEEWKGQAVFLDAVAALTPEVRELGTFVLVGGSVPGKQAYFDEISRRADDLGVTMLGVRSDVPAILRASDVSVHCSTEPDPFPGVVVESLLAGAALLGAGAGGVPEMISEPGAGVLVTPGDAAALAAAVADLIEAGPTPRNRYAKAARARGLALVDPAPIDTDMHALYTAILAARGEKRTVPSPTLTMTKAEKSRLLLETIGSPIGTGTRVPRSDEIESLTEFAFKSRVGLLFLDECLRKGVDLGPAARELHESLTKRRQATDDVIVRLAARLDEVAKGEWVLFKSIKPFASTPNDTDWFPFDPKRHGELCRHLMRDGAFKLLEKAPRQTTLIESAGEGVTDTTKAGGVYYIDCYIYPSTDYFIYLDPRRLRSCREETLVNGVPVPVLAPHAELAAIMFHNVFPERSFSIESYYLIKRNLEMIAERGSSQQFVRVCRDQKMEYAASVNLALVRDIDRAHFGIDDPAIPALLSDLGHPGFRVERFDPRGAFPYEFPNRVFWTTFLSKQRDRTSLASTSNQIVHMLNPVFFADVVKIIWRRSVKGGVYEQN